jgi:hypothetical protein
MKDSPTMASGFIARVAWPAATVSVIFFVSAAAAVATSAATAPASKAQAALDFMAESSLASFLCNRLQSFCPDKAEMLRRAERAADLSGEC